MKYLARTKCTRSRYLHVIVSTFNTLNSKLIEVFTDKPRFAVLHNRPTWRIGGPPVGRHLVGVGSVNNCKPVNRNSKIFLNFCLKVDFVYLLTIQLKLKIVLTREERNHN